MSKNLYLVPYDLTDAGNSALNYALHICKRVEAEIRILHLVSSADKIASSSAKIDQIINNLDIPEKASITKQVQKGSIFDDIGRIATKAGAQLIIMGTHGHQGIKKLFFRSNAIQVVTSCDIPFLIVQKNTKTVDLEKIVLPITLTKESLQVVNLAGDIANIYGAGISVVGSKQNDELLNQQMKNRIQIVKKQFDERAIDCNVELFKDSGSYSKRVIEFSKKNNIDLIAFAYHTESILPQFDKFAQNLITNKLMLPCLVLNSKPASSLYF